jgi:hypothetical protein
MAKQSDPAGAVGEGGAPLTPRQAREQAKIRARREFRVTYDLPPGLRERFKDLAGEQGIPASQLVTLALARFLRDLEEGKVDLGPYKQPSRSPRYDWNLVLPDRMIPKRKRRKAVRPRRSRPKESPPAD